MLAYLKSNLSFFLLIFIFTFLIWNKTLNQALLGEGYYYFDPATRAIEITSLGLTKNYDILAKITSTIIIPLFYDNIFLYQLFQLIIYILLYSTIFFIIHRITGSRIIAFTSVVFFMSNHTGSYEMIAIGNYQRFLQRVPNLIPTLLSFYFLYRYFTKDNRSDLYKSLLLYGISVFLSHYSSLLLPIFIILPLTQKKPLPRLLFISFLYFSITFSITLISDQEPGVSIFEYVFSEKNLYQKIVYQIPLITVPLELIISIAKNWPGGKVHSPFVPVISLLLYPTLLLYLIGGFFVYKKGFLKLYLTFFLGMVLHMFLYLYIDDKLNVLTGFGADRHFFISSLLASTIWALILYSILPKRYQFITFLILVIFVAHNISLINRDIDSIQYKSEAMKKMISYIKNSRDRFDHNSVLILPRTLAWPAPMLNQTYLSKVTIPTLSGNWQEETPLDKRGNIFVFDYQSSKDRLNEASEGRVIDLTDKFRRGETIKFLTD